MMYVCGHVLTRFGRFREFDRATWVDVADPRSKIHKGQVALLDEVNSKLVG